MFRLCEAIEGLLHSKTTCFEMNGRCHYCRFETIFPRSLLSTRRVRDLNDTAQIPSTASSVKRRHSALFTDAGSLQHMRSFETRIPFPRNPSPRNPFLCLRNTSQYHHTSAVRSRRNPDDGYYDGTKSRVQIIPRLSIGPRGSLCENIPAKSWVRIRVRGEDA